MNILEKSNRGYLIVFDVRLIYISLMNTKSDIFVNHDNTAFGVHSMKSLRKHAYAIYCNISRL